MAKASNMSLAELESMLKEQKDRLDNLKKKQKTLEKDLESVNREIATLEGKGSRRRGRPPGTKSGSTKKVRRRRAKNVKPLKAYVIDVLNANKKGLTLQEISDKVKEAGYKSKSKSFKNVLYQCLYHNREFMHDSDAGIYKLR
jgi:chromosome segregation ATPase